MVRSYPGTLLYMYRCTTLNRISMVQYLATTCLFFSSQMRTVFWYLYICTQAVIVYEG
eukprot:SAG11_NODE_4400_length_1911_cov_1.211369_4_plen_58_part_00